MLAAQELMWTQIKDFQSDTAFKKKKKQLEVVL